MALVKVNNNRYTVDSLYQWDKNQTLEIHGLSLPSTPQIHFANIDMSRAISRESTMDNTGVIRVEVPDTLLQKPHPISVYVGLYEGDSFNTLYTIIIPVKARAKPGDYSIDGDEDVYSYIALENLINNSLTTAIARYDEVDKKYNEALKTMEEANKTLATAISNYDDAIKKIDESLEVIENGSY